MDILTEIWTAWNEQLGVTIATILAVIALLKSMSKETQDLVSSVWRWKGWGIVFKLYKKAENVYRVRSAKRLMRRTLEEVSLQIEIRAYDNCLRIDPGKSTRSQLEEITPAKPSWLNDYYVATALESLSNDGTVIKAKRFSVTSWPSHPEIYEFRTVNADRSASEEAARVETNDQCAAYQSFGLCRIDSRFEQKHEAKTVSPKETRFKTIYVLKDTATPCELCWEKERQERDIRLLVDNITKYDLADKTTSEITGTDGEFQEAVAVACIEGQYPAEAELIKPVVKQAIDIRQRQVALGNSRLQYEWRQDERQELVATLKKYINSQTVR